MLTTFTNFLLQNHTDPNLTLILTQIDNAAKVIASHVKQTGIVDILGADGTTNSSGETVQKLDRFADDLFCNLLSDIPSLYAFASEERDDLHVLNPNGQYTVFFDPLDGSSNIDVNISVGSIFSIYKHNNSNILPQGQHQLAAGYIMYGSSVMLMLATSSGLNGFTLDPGMGSFLLTDPDLHIPDHAPMYSINEAHTLTFDQPHQAYLHTLKQQHYSMRYVGSMIADIHRTIFKGGIFLYPATQDKPQGKLRLMFEINPMSFLITQAGGQATSRGHNPLTLKPQTLHQRAPIALGSPQNIKQYLQSLTPIT